MKHGTHCKFCHMPITLTISDDYDPIGDPMKLLAFAACNQCADLRENRRNLEEALIKLCLMFHRAGQGARAQMRETVKASLETLTKKYTRLIGDWHNITPEWQQSIVNRLVGEPDRAWLILNSLWPKLDGENPF